jgi:hypothetical protein
MLWTLARWLGMGTFLVLVAVGVNSVVPAISGHIAMGVAAVVLFAVLYLGQRVGIVKRD